MREVDAHITIVLGQLINCPRHIGIVAAGFIDLTMELYTQLSSFFLLKKILIWTISARSSQKCSYGVADCAGPE